MSDTDATPSLAQLDPALLQRVADELEIRNVVARLAHFADTATDEELQEYLTLFTEDATWMVVSDRFEPPPVRHGHAELLIGAQERREANAQGPGSNCRHPVSTHSVVFETPDRARSRAYWQNITQTTSATQVGAGCGEYRDTFVRTPTGWKVERRELHPG